MSCKGRVTNIVFENCKATVYYSDCTSITYNISNCGDKTPESKKPGDWPPPDPVEDVRCRVAIKVGQQAAERLNNYLSGLILTNPGANLPALYSSLKIAEYGWSISLYNAMFGFYWDGVFAGGGTPGDAAKDDWDANSAAIIVAVQEALYCTLPESGEITETTVEVWVGALNGMGTEFCTLLASLLLIWPLAQLREMAFNASTTTDAVDCEDFNCGGAPSGDPCAGLEMVWLDVGATPSTWENIPGTIDTSGWSGDVEGITQSPPGSNVDYTASRTPNGNWIHTGAAMTAIGVAVRYTPEVPCVVSHAAVSYAKNSGNSILLSIVGRRASDGVYQVLSKQIRAAIQPLSGALVWTGSPIALSEVLFIIHSSNSSATAQVQITRCEVNHPEP